MFNLADLQQKVRSTAATSFSVLGLFITLSIGVFIILLSYTIEPLVSLTRRKRQSKSTYRSLEWIMNETLQLQRMAHEELGAGTWTGTTDSCPVTLPEQKLAMLDVSDIDHPVLIQSTGFQSKVNSRAQSPSISGATSDEDIELGPRGRFDYDVLEQSSSARSPPIYGTSTRTRSSSQTEDALLAARP